jgi:outer membrane protein OmpA-like peptidoglycan-associated protein
MKQLFTIFCLACALLFVQQSAFAQPTDGLAFRYNFYNYLTPSPEWEDWTDIYNLEGRGIEFAYNRNLSKRTWLVVPVKFGQGQFAPGRRNELAGNLDLLLQNNLFPHDWLISPTVSLGIGSTYNFDADEFDFNIPAALGFNIRLLPNLFANIQSQHRFSIENRPGWHHSLGIVNYFGESNPDRDKDGISDKDDKCPDVPGVASLMGCPDKDLDGITDADDKCPDVPGVAAMMGCPDKDGDMIMDTEDDCPDVAGLAAFKGCPDTDNDGIKDADDKCPREAGPASNNGCPVRDRDGDGIEDKDDKCPDAKGPVNTGGCPDRDSDGVADKDDACPDKKGDSMHKGCPDSDGDGIYDNEDRCPDKAGIAALKGCPEIKKEDKAKLERAIKLVQFQTGKDVLLDKSYPVLDEVVSVMKQYPEYSLNIAGHTDSQGDDKFNQELSERRAKRCYDYLLSKGMAASRIASTGFGETKPVGDNKTAAGREQNRRVEFELYVK